MSRYTAPEAILAIFFTVLLPAREAMGPLLSAEGRVSLS